MTGKQRTPKENTGQHKTDQGLGEDRMGLNETKDKTEQDMAKQITKLSLDGT